MKSSIKYILLTVLLMLNLLYFFFLIWVHFFIFFNCFFLFIDNRSYLLKNYIFICLCRSKFEIN